MDDQHRPADHPGSSAAATDAGQALWDSTVAALAAAGIEVVQAGDGRPGAVLQASPNGLAVAVRWQPTEQHLLPGGALSARACRSGPVPARQIYNLMLQHRLDDAGLRTVYADEDLVVAHPDLEIPGWPWPRPVRSATLSAPGHPAADPAVRERGPGRWPARWLRRGR
ncbi:hypothetical protein ACWCYY_40130 [Kitasatospora sp. NPDC001664]